MAEVNLGFELGDLSGWVDVPFTHEPWQVEVVAGHADTQTGALTLPHEGAYMLRLGAVLGEWLPEAPAAAEVVSVTRHLELENGQTVSGWFALAEKSIAGGGRATVFVDWAGGRVIAADYLGDDPTWRPWSYTATQDAVHSILLVVSTWMDGEAYALFDGFTVSEASSFSSQTGAVQVLIRCVVSTTGAVHLGLAVNVGGGAVRAALGFYVSARGRAVAPLYVVRRNPRFALRAVGEPPPPYIYRGEAELVLVFNVYDTEIAGIGGSVNSCSLHPGLRACMGVDVCIASLVGMPINSYWYSVCSPGIPFKAFNGAARLMLMVRVVPTAKAGQVVRWHSPLRYSPEAPLYGFKIEPVGGRLVLPLQLGGQGAELYPVGSDRRFAVPAPEVAPVLFGEGMNIFSGCNPRELVIGTWSASGISGVSLYWCSIHPDSPLRVSSMMRGHARYESEGFSWEVWPDGTASLTRWAKYWGKEGLIAEGGGRIS